MKRTPAQRGPGRPRSFDRQTALWAALRLFREHGYEGTSMADLQGVLSLSPPSIYAAFGSKEALFKEAVALYTSQNRARISRAIEDAHDTKAAVEAMLRSAVRGATEPDEPRGCLLVQGALACSPAGNDVQQCLHEERMSGHRMLVKRLKDGVAAGDIPARVDVGAVASFYSTLINGISIQARDGASRASLMAAVDCAMAAWDTLTKP